MKGTFTLAKWAPNRSAVFIWTVVLLLEGLLILAHVRIRNAELLAFHLYPFIWINASVWALWNTTTPAASRRTKRIASIVAVGYFLVLGYFGGLIREGHAYHAHHEIPPEHADFVYGADLALSLPPGYGPAFTYSSPVVIASISPYMLVGFIVLAYLLYVTVLDASGDASIGVVGIFSCIGCSFPLIAALVSGASSTTFATLLYSRAYALSTIAFVFTLLFLYWRPLNADDLRPKLLASGIALVLVSATVHVGLGIRGIVVGRDPFVLSVLFVLVAIVSYVLVGGYATGLVPRTRAIPLSAGLMFFLLVLYFDWHTIGTVEALLPLESVGLEHDHEHGYGHEHGHGHDHEHGHGHGDSFLVQAGETVRNNGPAVIAKSAEFLALLLLGSVGLQDWVDDQCV